MAHFLRPETDMRWAMIPSRFQEKIIYSLPLTLNTPLLPLSFIASVVSPVHPVLFHCRVDNEDTHCSSGYPRTTQAAQAGLDRVMTCPFSHAYLDYEPKLPCHAVKTLGLWDGLVVKVVARQP